MNSSSYKLYNFHRSQQNVPDRTLCYWKKKNRINYSQENRVDINSIHNVHEPKVVHFSYLLPEGEYDNDNFSYELSTASTNSEDLLSENFMNTTNRSSSASQSNHCLQTECTMEAISNLSNNNDILSDESILSDHCEDINVDEMNSHQDETDSSYSNADLDIYGFVNGNITNENMNLDDGENNLLSYNDINSDNFGNIDNPHQSDSNGCGCDMNNNVPDNSSMITLKRVLFIMALKLRHWLTFIVTENIALLLKLDCNHSERPLTKYLLKKFLDKFSTSWAIHHICYHCNCYAGKQLQTKQNQLLCQSCGEYIVIQENITRGSTFLYLSLTEQLKYFMEMFSDIVDYRNQRIKERYFALEDVYDGKMFRYISNQVEHSNDMITLTFGFDGVPIFEKSNYSAHPILCTVNELPPKLRRKNVILCSVWCGKSKPVVNEYFKPFIAECNSLYEEGFCFTYNGVQVRKKCLVIMGICDSVARPVVQMSTQFNGSYGCSFCLHPGEQIGKGHGTVRVFPLCPEDSQVFYNYCNRTHDNTLVDSENQLHGMKGKSILFDIPKFNIISGICPEWMHCVGLGICRQFPKLWFDSVYLEKHFCFHHLQQKVDTLLLFYKPTIEISRTPRKISEYNRWKAHECIVWLLFYSIPTLKQVFPRKYVHHWALLVEAIATLLKKSISSSEISHAKDLLIEFVQEVEELYGREHVSFNIHLLIHLPQSVRDWGPLWTHSAFAFENFNQEIRNSVKSSKGVALQIIDNYRLKCTVHGLQMLCKENLTEYEQEYLETILSSQYSPLISQHVINAQMIGQPTIQKLSREHFIAFQRINISYSQSNYVYYYKRAYVNGELIHTLKYSTVKKRSNYYVILQDSSIFEIHTMIVLPLDEELKCYAIGKYFQEDNTPIIPGRKLEHFICLKEKVPNLAAVDASRIKEKVILIEIEGQKSSIACIYSNNDELLS